MATKKTLKRQEPRAPVFPPQKRMPVTVRDPLKRRIVKRGLPMAEEDERELDRLHGLDGW